MSVDQVSADVGAPVGGVPPTHRVSVSVDQVSADVGARESVQDRFCDIVCLSIRSVLTSAPSRVVLPVPRPAPVSVDQVSADVGAGVNPIQAAITLPVSVDQVSADVGA